MFENTADQLPNIAGLAAATGVGLLIGLVRERAHPHNAGFIAGLRTHTLAALLGALASWFGTPVLVVCLGGMGVMAALAYRRSAEADPGLTSEVTLLLTPLLGALALTSPPLAAGIGVAVALLLQAKARLHRFSRELLSEQEVHDGLMLLAAALVVLPLMPHTPIDPWGVLRPQAVWRLVVLVMGVGVVGHVALRAIGARWGLPIAGFFSGFVSSTAAVVAYAERSRSDPSSARINSAAALLANLASLIEMVAVVATVSLPLLKSAMPGLVGAGLALLVAAAANQMHRPIAAEAPPQLPARSFHLGHALLLAVAISTVALISAGMQHALGNTGALITATLAAVAEWHAAAASLAQLVAAGHLDDASGRWGIVALLAASATAKSLLAWLGGSREYARRVMFGVWTMVAAAAVAVAI